MKKGLKIAGAIAGLAAVASLLPYSVSKDQENDKTTARALLWKYTNQPDPKEPGSRKVVIDIGFQNPLSEDNDHLLMDEDDDLLLLDTPEEAPQNEIELTLEPDLSEEVPAPETPEF